MGRDGMSVNVVVRHSAQGRKGWLADGYIRHLS
jgi:hypothetical protein